MRINASNIAMEAEHSYRSSGLSLHVIKDMARDRAAELDISDLGRSYSTLLNEDPSRRDNRQKEKQNNAGAAMSMLEAQRNKRKEHYAPLSEEESPEIRALKELLEMMRRWAKGDYSTTSLDLSAFRQEKRERSFSVGVSDKSTFTMFSGQREDAFAISGGGVIKTADLRSPGIAANGTGRLMTRVTASYNVLNESESTVFKTVGTALTDDGRELSFNVEFGMSRSFSGVFSSLEMEDYSAALCDPLVINVGADVTDVSDKKFFFDLDSDGEEEEISALEKGSGFLALDKNEDGEINDGSELFGTKSGDGFRDLASYDSDHNGWIDESDAIYNRLKVWFKEGDGADKLISLKEAKVGAIYLGNVNTDFADKNVLTGELNGIVRKTGIFLKENGGVGTLQHVDLAV